MSAWIAPKSLLQAGSGGSTRKSVGGIEEVAGAAEGERG